MNSFDEIPMSKASLDVWRKSLDLAGYEFETEQDFLNFVHSDPNQIAECQSFLNRISYQKYRLDQLDKEFS